MSRTLSFKELFDLEIEAWLHGIRSYEGELEVSHFHEVLAELKECFRAAIQHEYPFDLIKIAKEFAATKKLIPAKEIAFAVLAMLPRLPSVSEKELQVLKALYDQAEAEYGGVYERFSKSAPITEVYSMPHLTNKDRIEISAESGKPDTSKSSLLNNLLDKLITSKE